MLSCDCHVHIVGGQDRYPMAPERLYTPPGAPVAALLALRERLDIARNVLVQPSFYGTDNRCMLDALKELSGSARGVAVVRPDVDRRELEEMERIGVRGVRLNLETVGARDPAAAAPAIGALAQLVAPLGWHVQIFAALSVVAALERTFTALSVPVVIDHFGMARAGLGVEQPGFDALLRLVRSGRVWLKLSATYRLSGGHEPSGVADLAGALIAAAPERMLWGSDWPHTNREPGRAATDIHAPFPIDDVASLARLKAWAGNAATAQQILVDNPASLYRFA